MKRSADWSALLLAAGLVMGCTPETSAPPPSGSAKADESLRPDPKGGAGSGIRKKKKEPGLGHAMPNASRRPNIPF
jgi:hypothetical protein